MISANALGKDLCLGREREDICSPSSLHHCVSGQRLFLTVFQVRRVGRNVAVLFSSAAGIPRPVFPHTRISELMFREKWKSITFIHFIYTSHLQCDPCALCSKMLLEMNAANNFISFASSLMCFMLLYKDLYHNCARVFVSGFCC